MPSAGDKQKRGVLTWALRSTRINIISSNIAVGPLGALQKAQRNAEAGYCSFAAMRGISRITRSGKIQCPPSVRGFEGQD
jgi:hypothetical protein